MRFLLVLAFFLCVAGVFPARAERVMEVQGIRVEQTGEGGRESAVAKATEQAAAQVLEKLGHAGRLPTLSPAQLESLSTYVDVASESVQPNYYAGTFNIGIRVRALLRLAGLESGVADGAPTETVPTPSLLAGPQWVLVVPVRETEGAGVGLWNPADPWSAAWQRLGGGGGVTVAAASGDEKDRTLLPQTLVQSETAPLADPLSALARKYNAPAVALVRLQTERDTIRVDDSVQLEVVYLERGAPDVLTAQGSLTVSAAMAADPVGGAVREARRLITQLATGQPAEAGALPVSAGPLTVPPLSGVPGLSTTARTVYPATTAPAAPVPESGHSLWVRIPLSQPSDLATYRRRIDSIPGARFEITALNRQYVEGHIRYTGDQATLMRELTARGLGQQGR